MMGHTFKITFGLLCLVVGLVLGYATLQFPLNGEDIDCYDRHNNKILGQDCIVENSFDNEGTRYLLAFGLVLIITLFGVIMGSIQDSFENWGNIRGF